ncbi:MAG: hypothetical protein COV59_03380 [Candidatus Magasanikbacteria bacterium CG11_big_fil_rev_8_21_14_0_20_39_34]|uniref:Uncharacterized protein n=1 Tax=Candidatus Magasanikbacteria bacterium CG11_big_fil_rev_8_21_14_0_20_39_34 TaxID=1974653 RepID=A0A2H0N5N1_9BACT|nr:MAG: hypothetical protein COV59_03380 [Candidatus Magasanikbacteria bacterium CG11_big_fil_rev_8_21_14_0_20_39_34]
MVVQQRTIWGLLQEARDLECTAQRRAQIQVELQRAALGSELDTEGSAAALRVALVEQLFQGALRNRPGILLHLFPVFSALCGDRSDPRQLFAVVDWALLV